MKNEKTKLVVLAALLHDIGKLLERGEYFPEARKDDVCLDMCPSGSGGVYRTHLHAAHTRWFCDWLSERFDCLRQTSFQEWKEWCSAHHRNDEIGLESSAVRIADRLSSSEREEGDYYQRKIHQKTFLEPVLERIFLSLNINCLSTRFRYPLVRLKAEESACFPRLGKDLGAKEMADADGLVSDPNTWNHMIASEVEPVIARYRLLCSELLDDIEALARQQPGIMLEHLIVSLGTIFERYTANVPSATNVRHPDISLFDHLRSTAAIAQALYLYQMAVPEAPLRDEKDPKWLLVCGDFSGIQRFIYNLTNKGAAKGLRGRSFYVQYFCRIAADYLLRELGLTRAALLYNSGGKFYMLLPIHLRKQLYESRKAINHWLLEEFEGNVFFGLGTTPVTADMFHQGKMHQAWKVVAEDLERDRTTRFKDLFHPDFFEPRRNFNPAKSCEVCGSRQIDDKSGHCSNCEMLERLGSALKDAAVVLTAWGTSAQADALGVSFNTRHLLRFKNLGAWMFLVDNEGLSGLPPSVRFDGECTFLNEWGERDFADLRLPSCALTSLYLGKWDPDRQVKHAENGPTQWTFDDFAKEATGISRLGILRMDVDNLGLVFIRGLNFPKRDRKGWGDIERTSEGPMMLKSMASISRIATLSRQLNQFFAGYVPALLNRVDFNRCQTIYAGGDDLFVIGSWDQLPGLAKTIRSDFGRFCCGNPDFGISGGLTLHRGGYPIYRGAELAGQAEKAAKNHRGKWIKQPPIPRKDAFCFLGVPLLWEDIPRAEWIKALLFKDIKTNKGFLGFLTRVAAGNKHRVKELVRMGIPEAEAWKRVRFETWRWRTAYQLRRRFEKEHQKANLDMWAKILFADTVDQKKTELPVHSWIELPLRWTDYANREKGGR